MKELSARFELEAQRLEDEVLGQLRLAVATAVADPEATHSRLVDLIATLEAPTQENVHPTSERTLRKSLAPWQAKQVRDLIEADLDRYLSVRQLAEKARLSESYFSRAFRGSFGMAPHSYIMQRRVERAREWLRSSSEPIAQIALACGFCDQAHFSRTFSKHTGVPPGAWRRQFRRGDSGERIAA